MSTTTVTHITEQLKEKLHFNAQPAPEKPKQPDITYHPNEDNWRARTARRLAENPALPQTSLPPNFPTKLDSPLVWQGSDWKNEQEWVHNLDDAQLKEIDDAVQHFKSLNLPLGRITQETFPLPTLGPVLKALSHELHAGRGFFVLRTLPVDAYSRADIALAYAGVSAHVGALRGRQDANGAVLAHIKDLSQTHAASIGAPAYTTDKQVFHTDAGDIVALLALQTAAAGGVSRISSSWRVYNELAETRPDLIKTLSEPWPVDTFGGDPPYNERPLLFWEDNKIIIQYARRLFTGFLALPRSPTIPPITEAQAEALDTLHYLAEKYNLGLNFQKGDIQYINNLSIFHARDEFTDDPEKTRHLLRLWLRNEEFAWKTPKAHERSWRRLYYELPPEEQRFPLEPEVRRALGTGSNSKDSSQY